jgi:Bacterial PH domain
MLFKAKYNGTAIFLKIVLPIVLGLVLFALYFFIPIRSTFFTYVISIFCVVVWGLLFVRSITHYTLQQDALIVYKRVGKIVIKYSNVFAVAPYTADGQDGIGLSQNYEDMYWYTTITKNNIAIYVDHKKLLVSPENPELFIQELQKKINQYHAL